MQNRTVAAVWILGLALAALIYVLGPDDALARLSGWADQAGGFVTALADTLGGRALDILRAMAIGCFTVFFALSIVATGRGHPSVGLMLVVTVLFLLLVWHQGREAAGHWTLALLLAASAAMNVTRRLQ